MFSLCFSAAKKFADVLDVYVCIPGVFPLHASQQQGMLLGGIHTCTYIRMSYYNLIANYFAPNISSPLCFSTSEGIIKNIVCSNLTFFEIFFGS